MNTACPDLRGKQRTKAVPPIPHGLIADLDAALEQEVFDLSQRQRVSDIQHHREADHFGRTVEITEGISHRLRLRNSPSPLKPIYSDGAQRTYRIDREAGLQVRTNKRKQVVRLPSPGAGSRHSQCALVDGLRRGPLANARRLRVLKTVDFSLSGRRLANELGQRPRPLPKTTVGDNGLAFTSKARNCWAKRSAVKLYFIQPGKPAQNACVERFNGKFRE